MEFLNRLGELLACLPADQVKETQEFYAEAIADRMEDGMTEAEAVAAMGTPVRSPRQRSTNCRRARARSRGPSARARHFYGRSPSWALRYGFRCCSRSSPVAPLQSTSVFGFLRSACGSWPRHSGARAW